MGWKWNYIGKGVAICLLLVAVSLLCGCKKEEEKSWSLVGKWTVERVTVQGVEQKGHAAIGRVYEFLEDGKCTITEPGGQPSDAGKWERDESLKLLIIGNTQFYLYRAEGSTLDFGLVVSGRDYVTYHAVR